MEMPARTLNSSKFSRIKVLIGNTPLVKLDFDTINLYAKLEFNNFMGSIKDRAAFGAIEGAIARGEINGNSSVVESSSGNFAISLAAICKSLDMKFVAVIDPSINPIYERNLRLLTDHVVKVTERDPKGGYLLTRLSAVDKLRAQDPTLYWTHQYSNRDILECHYHGVGAEIADRFDSLDYAFIAVSTAGTIANVSRRLKKKFPNVKIIAVDTEGSVIFGAPPKPRHIPGIGAGIVPELLKEATIDDVLHVSESETVSGCYALLEEHGIFAGGSTGTVYFAIKRYFDGLHFKRKPNAVFLCPDKGTAYLDTVYDKQWVERFIRSTVATAHFPPGGRGRSFGIERPARALGADKAGG